MKPGQMGMVVRTHVNGVRYVPDEMLRKTMTVIKLEKTTPALGDDLWSVDRDDLLLFNAGPVVVPLQYLDMDSPFSITGFFAPGQQRFYGPAMYDAVLMPITPEQTPNEFEKLVEDNIVRDARIPETTS